MNVGRALGGSPPEAGRPSDSRALRDRQGWTPALGDDVRLTTRRGTAAESGHAAGPIMAAWHASATTDDDGIGYEAKRLWRRRRSRRSNLPRGQRAAPNAQRKRRTRAAESEWATVGRWSVKWMTERLGHRIRTSGNPETGADGENGGPVTAGSSETDEEGDP